MFEIREKIESDKKWSPIIEWSSENDKEPINHYATNENDIIRKLGPSELVYEHEMKDRGMLLPFSVLFSSKNKLFHYKKKIEVAFNAWKHAHPLLRAKIMVKPDPMHADFSRDRYFVYASKEKINSMDNVKYLRVRDGNWQQFHQRELNTEPVDSQNGLLWRISFIEMQNNQYCLIFTCHHSILDGLNATLVLQHLFTLIEKSITKERIEQKLIPIHVSMEEKLFKNNQNELKALKLNHDYHVPPNDKIPKEFKKTRDAETCAQDRTKFKCFTLEASEFHKLYLNAKANGVKIAGCLNIVCALAVLDLYKEHNVDGHLTNKIYFHMLANLRRLLKMDNLTMGFWAVVMSSFLDAEPIKNKKLDKEFLAKNFWSLAKKESDSIHKRIDENEWYQNAKLSNLLLDLMEMGVKFENGSSHFCMSNLGRVPMNNLSLFKVTDIFFSVSVNENRWSAVCYHGVCTIEDKLCWSLCYNSRLFDDCIIDSLIDKIGFILDCISD
jgi:hypothetical protein